MRSRNDGRDAIVFAYAYAASDRDAVARVIGELAAELRERGRFVRVIGMPSAWIVDAGGSPSDKLRRLWSELRFVVRLLAVVLWNHRRIQAFVSVDVPSGLPLVGSFARLVSGGRVRDIAWVMDLYRLASSGGDAVTRLRKALELIALKKSGAIVTIGSCMADRLESITDRTVEVIPIWHRQIERRDRPRREGHLRLLYSGSARELHPLQGLLEAVADRPGVELLISGSGTEVERARQLLARRPVSNITIGGFIPDGELATYYGDADMHVVSLAEEMTGTCVPSKVYAAMAAGRAVLHLGSDRGQAAQDVRRAQAGVVVPTDDVDAIGKALDMLVADRSGVAQQGAEAAAYFDAHRTIASGAEAWNHLLRGGRMGEPAA